MLSSAAFPASAPRYRGAVAAARPALVLVVLALLAVGCDYGTETRIIEDDDLDVQVFTFAFDGDDLTVIEEGRRAFAQVEVDALTLDIVDFGVVLAYADGRLLSDEEAGITWVALPITIGEQADDDIDVDYTLTYGYSYEVGFFYVDLLASEPLDWEAQPILDIKVVLIPGGDVLDLDAVDTSSYAALERALDLDAKPMVRATVRAAR